MAPTDELRTAAKKLRSGALVIHIDYDLPIAALLDGVLSSAREADHEECQRWCSPDTCDMAAALAVARQINGTAR
ncbi:hypothetical protein ACIQPQ_31460 [Streptomyces sp. NPDC091281]|uniref:hypothetical protein n=1 Tax=Streptomyces sp. NPDC091281 TaxID=3365985 RepID=UPI00381A5756